MKEYVVTEETMTVLNTCLKPVYVFEGDSFFPHYTLLELTDRLSGKNSGEFVITNRLLTHHKLELDYEVVFCATKILGIVPVFIQNEVHLDHFPRLIKAHIPTCDKYIECVPRLENLAEIGKCLLSFPRQWKELSEYSTPIVRLGWYVHYLEEEEPNNQLEAIEQRETEKRTFFRMWSGYFPVIDRVFYYTFPERRAQVDWIVLQKGIAGYFTQNETEEMRVWNTAYPTLFDKVQAILKMRKLPFRKMVDRNCEISRYTIEFGEFSLSEIATTVENAKDQFEERMQKFVISPLCLFTWLR